MLWSSAPPPPRQAPRLTIALTVAALDAARRGHAEVLPEHLVFAALFEVERSEAIRRKLEARLDAVEAADGPLEPSAVRLSNALLGALYHASRRAMGAMRPLTLEDVAKALGDDGRMAALLEEAHGLPEPPVSPGAPYRASASDAPAEIVIWNDEQSTMAGVLDVLRKCFAKGEAEALHVMLTTHYVGDCVIGRYPWEDATRLAGQAIARARGAGMPLRITVALAGERERARKSGLAARVKRFFSPRLSP